MSSVTNAIRIVAKPEPTYIEKSAAGQYLNSDFGIENLTAETIHLSQIEVSVYDQHAKLVLRKFVDESGSIQTIAERELGGGQSVMVFNPFFFFDHSIELHTLRYTFTFKREHTEALTAEVVVTPVYYETKTDLILPVKERSIIWDGHDFYSHHRRFNYLHPELQQLGFTTNFQRYGYDFVLVNEQGEMHHGPATENANWFGFGTAIYAPGAGVVADRFDGMLDNRTFDEAELATREMVYGGNYVLIDHLNGEFSYCGHLKQGSVSVQKGEQVKQGQVIGHMGASSSSLFPHLHYELRNGIGAKTVEGLPSYFSRFRRLLGAKTIEIEKGQIDTGDIVERE